MCACGESGRAARLRVSSTATPHASRPVRRPDDVPGRRARDAADAGGPHAACAPTAPDAATGPQRAAPMPLPVPCCVFTVHCHAPCCRARARLPPGIGVSVRAPTPITTPRLLPLGQLCTTAPTPPSARPSRCVAGAGVADDESPALPCPWLASPRTHRGCLSVRPGSACIKEAWQGTRLKAAHFHSHADPDASFYLIAPLRATVAFIITLESLLQSSHPASRHFHCTPRTPCRHTTTLTNTLRTPSSSVATTPVPQPPIPTRFKRHCFCTPHPRLPNSTASMGRGGYN
jgi:hypothetical protein